MTQHNENLPETSSSFKDVAWSRRRLLKELARAHGAMAGLMVLPTAWSKPLMDFAAVGALTNLSVPYTPPVKTCMTGSYNLTFPTANAALQINVYWWGVDQAGGGNDINLVLNQSTKTFSLQAKSAMPYTTSSITQTTLGTLNGDGSVTIPLSAITGTFTVGFTTTANTRAYTANVTENITLDFKLTVGSPSTLAISNPKSSHCA